MLFTFIFSLVHCSDDKKDAGLWINNTKGDDIVNVNGEEGVYSHRITGNDEQGVVKNNEHNTEEISGTNESRSNTEHNDHNLYDTTNKLRDGLSNTKIQDKTKNKDINSYNVEVENGVEADIKKVEKKEAESIVEKIKIIDEIKLRKASDALLFSLNKEIEEYNKARRLNTNIENFKITKTAIYKFLQISWMYKETLKYTSGVKEEFQRAEIIYNMLLREKNELELFIGLENDESRTHNEINAEDCYSALLGLTKSTGRKRDDLILQTLIDLTKEEWKTYNDAIRVRTDRCSQYRTYALKQTIDDIYTIVESTLYNIKNNGDEKDFCDIIEDVRNNLVYTMNDMDVFEKLRKEKYEIYLKELEARIRQLMVCLYMGKEESGEVDVENEIEEIYNLNYNNSTEEITNPYGDINEYIGKVQTNNISKNIEDNEMLSDLANSCVFTNIEPIKRKKQSNSLINKENLETKEVSNTLQQVRNDFIPDKTVINSDINDSIPKEQNALNMNINDESKQINVQPEQVTIKNLTISGENSEANICSEVDKFKSNNTIKAKNGSNIISPTESSKNVNAMNSKIVYFEKLIICTIVMCVLTAICILGAALSSFWKD